MKFKSRASLFFAGALIALGGYTMLQKCGIFPCLNWRMQPVYPAGVVVSGIVIAALAFLPSGEWIYRLVSTKPRREGHMLHVLDETGHRHNGKNHPST